jgi:tetratricopeptide (TPR) repeat protein
MKHKSARLMMLAVATMALPGCSTLFGKRFMAKADTENAVSKPAPGAATYSLDLGRQHLDAGRTGLAIEAFQTALVTGEAPAPAFNGLGVAFARLGRVDLAERYFQRATAIAPQDERYALNLARLTRSPAFALRRSGDVVAEVERAVAAAPPVAVPAQTMVAAEPVGVIRRVGKGQVFIQSSSPQAAPPRTARLAVDPRFKPVIRDEIAAVPKAEPETETQDQPAVPKARVFNFKPLVRDQLPPVRQ